MDVQSLSPSLAEDVMLRWAQFLLHNCEKWNIKKVSKRINAKSRIALWNCAKCWNSIKNMSSTNALQLSLHYKVLITLMFNSMWCSQFLKGVTLRCALFLTSEIVELSELRLSTISTFFQFLHKQRIVDWF